MSLYEASARTSIVTASVPIAAFKCITRPARIKQVEGYYVTAPTTSGGIALARSTAVAVTPGGAQVGLARNPSDVASASQLETTFGTAPTFTAAAFLRRWQAGPAIGNGFIWTWWEEEGLLFLPGAATSELVFVNTMATAAGTLEINVIYEE